MLMSSWLPGNDVPASRSKNQRNRKKNETQLNHDLKRNCRAGKMAEVAVLLQIHNLSEANGGVGHIHCCNKAHSLNNCLGP